MNNPTLLKGNVKTSEEAIEIMDYLYCERIGATSSNVISPYPFIVWYDKKMRTVAKWTKEYGNIMISKDFLEGK